MSQTIHASTVALGEHGVLVRGAAGAGKSALCLSLIDTWHRNGAFAALVADDYTAITCPGGRVIARSPSPIKGLVEIRGVGVLPIATVAAVRVTLVVELAPAPERMPAPHAQTTVLGGIFVPRMTLPELTGPQGASDLWHVLTTNGLTLQDWATQRDLSQDRA